MKKIFLALFLLTLMPLAGGESSLKFRAAAFVHTSQLFRDIYGDAGVCYEAEASTLLYRYVDGWANFDWFSDSGHSIGLRSPTRISIGNLSIGLRLAKNFTPKFRGYIGAGPSFGWVWIRNSGFCGNNRETKNVVGGVFKTGIYYFFTPRFFVDLFVDALYQPAHFESTLDIGGVKPGAGIGWRF